MSGKRIGLACIAAIAATHIALAGPARAEDRLLTEAVNFTGTLTFLNTKVPGLILVAMRNGEMAFAGFGDIADKANKTPDADTMFRIGSISKVFCGEVLASMVLEGKMHFADRLQDRLGYDVKLPDRDGHPIRLIDLVTQSSGLPREVPRADGTPDDPFGH
jgi:serine-type D-Ala-D-Ala carboxypeptidase/endopeptidase